MDLIDLSAVISSRNRGSSKAANSSPGSVSYLFTWATDIWHPSQGLVGEKHKALFLMILNTSCKHLTSWAQAFVYTQGHSILRSHLQSQISNWTNHCGQFQGQTFWTQRNFNTDTENLDLNSPRQGIRKWPAFILHSRTNLRLKALWKICATCN